MRFSAAAVPAETPAPAHACGGDAHAHAVQFYHDDEYLCATVADFIAEGRERGQPALVIATPQHGRAIEQHLAGRGVDARPGGGVTLLDARRTLDSFMEGALPDAGRFRAAVGTALEMAQGGSEGGAIRAFGEMVDLLWKDGNPEGALSLEALWNDLGRSHDFSLLCGYALGNFDRAEDEERFREVCRLHGHVVPTERYTQLDEAARLREVSVLQQRAQALEGELERRSRLELRLREGLAEYEALLERERAARAEAEEASRAKSEFLAMMSHELRTPLNAIAGYAELLEMGVHGPLSDPQLGTLARIQRNQRHLLGLITDVLGYARSEAHGLRYAIADVPLGQALCAAEESVFFQMEAKGLRYSAAACDPTLVVRADAEKLEQILLNLLGNAAKYTAPGGRVWVSCQASAARVRIRVHDSGIGISPEAQDAIFDPFFQVDGHLTRAQGGIGLGLATSRSLAAGMGGELTVESAPGQGSTFTLALPRSQTAPPAS